MMTREKLISIIERTFVDEHKWGHRDYMDLMTQAGDAYALLRCGCDFHVITTENATEEQKKAGQISWEKSLFIEIKYIPPSVLEKYQPAQIEQRNKEKISAVFFLPTETELATHKIYREQREEELAKNEKMGKALSVYGTAAIQAFQNKDFKTTRDNFVHLADLLPNDTLPKLVVLMLDDMLRKLLPDQAVPAADQPTKQTTTAVPTKEEIEIKKAELSQKAMAAQEAKDWKKAKAYFEELDVLIPDHPTIKNNIHSCDLWICKEENEIKAQALFEKQKQLSAEAFTLMEIKNYDGAKKIYEQLLDITIPGIQHDAIASAIENCIELMNKEETPATTPATSLNTEKNNSADPEKNPKTKRPYNKKSAKKTTKKK